MSKGGERRFIDFADFLAQFILELNGKSSQGWVVLVEGKRDLRALRMLGYDGGALTVATAAGQGRLKVRGAKKVVILTDMDSEGGRMGSKYQRMLSRTGVEASLGERRRLLDASKGVFRHIENLSRFSLAWDQ